MVVAVHFHSGGEKTVASVVDHMISQQFFVDISFAGVFAAVPAGGNRYIRYRSGYGYNSVWLLPVLKRIGYGGAGVDIL